MTDFEPNDPNDPWLTLHEASEKMGVSPATLRAWADQGHIPSYRTPGGHRRFRIGASNTLLKKDARGLSARWRLLEHSVLGRVQLREEREDAKPLPAAGLKEQQELKRRFIRLCILALQKERADLSEPATELGEALGKWNWRYGITPREGFENVGRFRRAMSDSVVEFAFGVGEPNVDELNLWLGRMNEIIDLVSVPMLEYGGKDQRTNAGK